MRLAFFISRQEHAYGEWSGGEHMGECGLFLGSRQIGTVRWWESDGKTVLHASCPWERDAIYRLVLNTGREERRLGVMLPKENTFFMQKVLSPAVTPLRGLIDRTLPGEEHLPGLPIPLSAFVSSKRHPEDGMRCAVWDQTEYLLYPFAFGKACALPQFLFLTQILQIGESMFAVIPMPWDAGQDRFRDPDGVQ